jgi:hypothetical protein
MLIFFKKKTSLHCARLANNKYDPSLYATILESLNLRQQIDDVDKARQARYVRWQLINR